MTAADAKKNGYPIFAAPKHTVKGNVSTVDLAGNTASVSPKKQLKQPSSATGVKSGLRPPTATSKAPSEKKLVPDKNEPAISASEDPIGAAIQIRNGLGGLSNNMQEAEAKKKKVYIPTPLKLKAPPKGGELLDLVGDTGPTESKDASNKLAKKQVPGSLGISKQQS